MDKEPDGPAKLCAIEHAEELEKNAQDALLRFQTTPSDLAGEAAAAAAKAAAEARELADAL